jgi:hypothetical protein
MHLDLYPMFFKYRWNRQHWPESAVKAPQKQLDLACARGDTASLQAVVWSENAFALTTGADPYFWKAGSVPIGRIEVLLEQDIPVECKLVGLIPDDNGTPVSDILLDQTSIYVEPRKLQPVWIECQIAAHMPPGLYHGRVRLYQHELFEDEQLLSEQSFSLTVKDVLLPEPKDYQFYLNLWQHCSNIARKYQVALWSDEHFTILEEYVSSLSRLGQKSVSVVVSEIPWSGQRSMTDPDPSDLFEYNMVRVTKTMRGAFEYDFSAVDRYVALADKYHMASEIELLGLINIWQLPQAGYGMVAEDYPDAIRIRYYDAASGAFKFMRARTEIEEYIRALETFFKERDWVERVRVSADEPNDVEEFKARWNLLHSLAPSFKLRVSIDHIEFLQQEIPNLYDAIPILFHATQDYQKTMALRDSLPGKMLYYVCCNPRHPNTFLESEAIECRVLPLLTERLQLDGFLRWNFTAWPDRPLEKISYRPEGWRAGDTNFVYPGPTGKPLLSLRYKWLERGIKDYELLQIAKRNQQGEWVESILKRIFIFEDPGQIQEYFIQEEVYSLNQDDYDRLLIEWPSR